MKKTAIILASLSMMVAIAALTAAEVPKTINYQARLTDLAGNPIADGTPSVTFRLYESATAAIAEAKWTDTFDVHTKNGFFNVLLGSGSVPFPGTLDFSKQYWVGIKVGSDDEMTDRLPLASVPYAMRAETANSANTATAIADNCVTSAKIATNAVVAAKIADGAVSTQAKAPWAPEVYYLASGASTLTKINNPRIVYGRSYGSNLVSFPAGTFTNPPAVSISGGIDTTTNPRFWNIVNVTASGFKVIGYQWNGSLQYYDNLTAFDWVAVGQ